MVIYDYKIDHIHRKVLVARNEYMNAALDVLGMSCVDL